MRNSVIFVIIVLAFQNLVQAQSLGRVGNPNDIVTTCTKGTVLMGGGTDVDAAFTWMINKSGNGDFVVIRATGTNAYNTYIYSLGTPNSVETFLINSVALANDSSIVQAVRKAEAVFFAGGNQNDYITYYKGTALGTALDYLANVKQAPIGGTSAGMAIQGYVYYDGVTNVLSPDVLLNPYASATGIHYNNFLHNPFLTKTICDTHFITKGGTTSNGITGRQGRLMSFLARMITDSAMTDVKGIACEEKTAVCIDENGIGMVVGLGNAYFLKQWCAVPETCVSNVPLTWTNGAKVYIITGPGNYTSLPSNSKSVNLNNWTTVSGGTYNYWTVNNGVLTIGQTIGTPTVCNLTCAAPTPVITANGATTFCQGGSVTLASSLAASYLWNNGATTQSITVSTAGNYSVTITDSSGCTASASETITVHPAPIVSINGPATACQGSNPQLCVISIYNTYLWSGGESTNCITPSSSGNYAVVVTDGNGCTATATQTLSFVNIQPSINEIAGYLTCDTFNTTFSYSWMFNGLPSACAGDTCVATLSGTYSVTVTDTLSGCSEIAAYNFINTGLNSSVNSYSSTFIPNVFTGNEFNVCFKNMNSEKTELLVYDIEGRIIWKENISVTEKEFIHKVTLPESKAGFYYVRIRNKDGDSIGKIVSY